MRNTLLRETASAGAAVERVRALLPPAWRADLVDIDSDAPSLRLIGGRGNDTIFPAVIGSTGDSIDDALNAARSRRAQSASVIYLIDYAGPRLREALEREGIGYADATGWVRVISDEPLLLLTGTGADRSPRAPESSAVTRLNGLAAGRLLRTLPMTGLPVGVRELAIRAGVSPGSASKLLTTLAAEGVVDRGDRGQIEVVRARRLAERWARDYSFTSTNPIVRCYIAPRGIERTLNRMDAIEPAALTGSAAARALLPPGATSVVPLRLLTAYVESPAVAAGDLGLIDADIATANVLLATPQDLSILPAPAAPPALAPASLVVADLLTLPGRSTAEADQLMEALAKTNPAWKE